MGIILLLASIIATALAILIMIKEYNNEKRGAVMKHIDHINILTKRYHPWEVTELQNLIADGLRSLKCKSIRDEIPVVSTECKDCEYKHLCKTLRKVYRQINDIKVERGDRPATIYGENFLKKFTKKY